MSQPLAANSELPAPVLTSHAMLVPWGIFAQRIGLVRALEAVPIPQRSRDHLPQTKLIEFLVAILAGCPYLQDISHGAHPLDQDQAVAQAWGQPRWADYSGVSRTLHACDETTLAAIREALEAVSRPFVQQEVIRALREQGQLVYDGDLTGRPVSNTSTTYPGAAFGWMGDGVHFGYQAAMVSMHSPTYGRLWLAVAQHPGDTVSSTQAEAMVRAAEAATGARPWRRTELLAQRIAQQEKALQEAQQKAARARERLERTWQQLAQAEQEQALWKQRVVELEVRDPACNRPPRPHGRLAQARRKLATWERRRDRRQHHLERARRTWERCEQKVSALQRDVEQLQERLARFQEDNRTNLWPVRAVFRLDAGFGSGPNIALLAEMGYEVFSKVGNIQQVRALRRRVTENTPWVRVGKNAEMVAWANEQLANCPYPVDVALERFHTGDHQRYSVLVHYGSESATGNLEEWFNFYNGRQDVEAGIKEGKHVFQMRHLKVRARTGLIIQEEFAAFAANLVRWAAVWLWEHCQELPAPLDSPRPTVKPMVRIAANTSAWVYWQPQGCLLRFTELSAFPGVELVIRGPVPFQLPLPVFKSCNFAPI